MLAAQCFQSWCAYRVSGWILTYCQPGRMKWCGQGTNALDLGSRSGFESLLEGVMWPSSEYARVGIKRLWVWIPVAGSDVTKWWMGWTQDQEIVGLNPSWKKWCDQAVNMLDWEEVVGLNSSWRKWCGWVVNGLDWGSRGCRFESQLEEVMWPSGEWAWLRIKRLRVWIPVGGGDVAKQWICWTEDQEVTGLNSS